jgi:iron complex outermembrane receptor protein
MVAFFAISLSAAAQTGSITGKVTDAAGKALTGANIAAVSGARTAATVVTGADGNYRLSALPAGTYTVVATKIGYAAKRTEAVSVSSGGTATENFVMTEFAVQLNPVVTTGTRGTPEKILDSPSSISVVSAERIGSRPATTVVDLVRTMPGVSASQGGLVQSNTVVRGFNNAFSGAMLNMQDYRFAGVPSLRVNIPFLYTGTSDDIDRIEVLNGPASALYGPNSANGVLHIITKSPFQSKGTILSVEGGGQALFRAAGRNAGTFGDKSNWGYKLSGEYLTGTEWAYTDPNEPATFPNDSAVPAARRGQPISRDLAVRHYTGEARLDYRASDADLENVVSYGYSKIGNAIELTTAFGAAQVKNWSYSSLQDRFRYKKFFAQVFYNGNNSGNSDPNDLTGTYFLRTGIPVVDKSTVTVGQVQQGFDIMKAKFVVGGDYIATAPRSEGSIFGRNEGSTDITEYGAYLQTTLPLTPKLDLVSAFRGDHSNQLTGTQFSPRIAFVYRPDADNNLRFTFSRAFNSPQSFAYFLDQVQNPNAAPGFALRAIGNPPKEGWLFNRSCDATINLGLCMHSPWMAAGPTAAVSSSAANAFPGFVTALPSIINGLPTLTATQKAQLTGLLAQLNPILSQLRPTSAQVGTVLLNGAPLAASSVVDLSPLTASFNNTWELGYKGIIGDRLRVTVDVWYQIRSDVGQPIGQANPLVLYDPTSLTTYLATNITAGLVAGGASQAVAAATAQQAVAALVPVMAALPQGTLAFTNAKLGGDQSIIATYRNGTGDIDVHGLDFAADYQLSDNWLIAATYSNQDKIVFPEQGGALNALMSNTPKHRASMTFRYANETSGWTYETGARYSDAFPVNSGLLNSFNPNTNPAGAKSYPPVKAQTQFDFATSYRLPIPQHITWSLSINNIADNRVPTFVGTPGIGRLVLTKLKYEF